MRQDDGRGDPIKVKAVGMEPIAPLLLFTLTSVAVWDTVGSLGIPQVTWLKKLGFHASNRE